MPRPRASGGPLGPAASEIKTLNICLSANDNYLNCLFIMFYLFDGKFLMYIVINSSN
jgi:hypothetical protein